MVTVPVEEFPPTTVDGCRVNEATFTLGGGKIVAVALTVWPPYDAVTVTVVLAWTATVVAISCPLNKPCEMFIGLAKVRVAGSLLVSVTFARPKGAGSFRKT